MLSCTAITPKRQSKKRDLLAPSFVTAKSGCRYRVAGRLIDRKCQLEGIDDWGIVGVGANVSEFGRFEIADGFGCESNVIACQLCADWHVL